MSKWEYNAKLFLDNYKTACEVYGSDGLTWLAVGIPAQKRIAAVHFVPKDAEAIVAAAAIVKSVYPPPVELLGAETATEGIPQFSSLKFSWSLLKGISAQKLAQRLVSVKHSDTLAVPVEDSVCRVKIPVKLSELDGKSVEDSVSLQIQRIYKNLDNLSLIHKETNNTLKSDGKGNSLKAKDQKKEQVALRVHEFSIQEDQLAQISNGLEGTDLKSTSTVEYELPIVLRVHNDISDSDLVKLIVESTKRLLHQLENIIKTKASLIPIEVLYFNLSGSPASVAIVVPKEGREGQIERISKPLNRPARDFGATKDLKLLSRPLENGLLANPHEFLKVSPIGQVATVLGRYDYHHYMQDNFDDSGWGCAYRSFQTVFSWLRLQGFTDKPVPSHKDIQECLVEIGDKPASFVGSKKWIGSMELSFCLSQMLGIESKVLTTNSGTEIAEHARTLIFHFENHGAPVMIGGGMLAHTILGVDYNTKSAECKYLVLDPHYTGDENLQTVLNGGWCAWKTADFWKKGDFYNLLLPQTETK
ncbi:unnamed protein product [Bursaphelenchus xylophilus]|uniref:Ufm1-specific protease n=1 Tax=Bursaphelenchus xylophilus TaxID=6326 RepID=A0A1I7RJ34_BURXY|nr:unnamed protein product [Bursaphelenchus xylophilus]CAG9119310.1 unnamed protein product [Bursaphelenchus xylophilus]